MRLKLGMYRKYMKQVCDKYNLTRLELEILLYGLEQDLGFSYYDISKHVPASKSAIGLAMIKMNSLGYFKIIREYSKLVSRKYIVKLKGRNVAMNFYNKFI